MLERGRGRGQRHIERGFRWRCRGGRSRRDVVEEEKEETQEEGLAGRRGRAKEKVVFATREPEMLCREREELMEWKEWERKSYR